MSANPPNLRTVLSLADTGWTTGNVESVLQKLQKIGIRDASGLASSLRFEEGRGLNADLKRFGYKGFSPSTLEALHRQVEEYFPDNRSHAAPVKSAKVAADLDAASREALSTQGSEWLVVHTRVIQRASPSLDADAKGVVKMGRTVHGWPIMEEGREWLQVPDTDRHGKEISLFMLIDGQVLGLGPLLKRVQPKKDVARPESLQHGSVEDYPWLLGLRPGTKVFLTSREGLRLEVSAETETLCAGRSEETWHRHSFTLERGGDASEPLFPGDAVHLRTPSEKLLTTAGDLVIASASAKAASLPSWTLESTRGEPGPLYHGQTVRLRSAGGELVRVDGCNAQLRDGDADACCDLLLEKDIRKPDLPDWEVPANAGWWRVTHRPSIWVHVWPDQYTLMPAAYSTDTILACEDYWHSESGELWLRLRDAPGTWARKSALDEGFDNDIMELLPTHCGPPDGEARQRHYRAVEAMHSVRPLVEKAMSRGDRPPALIHAQCTEEMVADVFAAEHAGTTTRSVGHLTAAHASPAALAMVGDLNTTGSFARRLLRDGFAVFDNALSRREAAELCQDAERLDRAGLLQEPEQPTPGQRGDRIVWLSETSTKFWASRTYSPPVASAISLLKGVADALNPALSRHHSERRAAGDLAHLAPPAHPATDDAVLTVAPRAMLATYPGGGARYIAHQDNMYRRAQGRRGNPRELTAIVYATNQDWDAKQDGGELKIYLRSEQFVESPEDKGHREVAYVAPLPGRLVVFFSALWHEVLPAWRERRAVTLWIFRPSAE